MNQLEKNNNSLRNIMKSIETFEKLNESKTITPESLAKMFHDTYEKLAPEYNYKTRKDSAVKWEDVPQDNKSLMIATSAEIIKKLNL